MMSSTCIPRTRDLVIVVDQHENKKMRRLSKDVQQMLNKAFGLSVKSRQGMFKEGEKHFAGEMFRFYAAILEFETLYKQDKRRGRLQALKLVSTFVEPGSIYENGCLSSATRERLLLRKVTDVHFFDDAKYEVANDIQTNPVLRGIIERYALGSVTIPHAQSDPEIAVAIPVV